MQNIRVGFLGAGWISGEHAKALSRLPDITLAAVCDQQIDKAQAFSKTHAEGAAACYGELGRMLESEKLDAMYICLPPGAYNGQAEAVAAKGIHLMLEKPIALDMVRAESIAAAVKKAGVKCQIGHHLRHAAPVKKLKDMLRDGTAGRPLMMQGRFFVNSMFSAWWRNPKMSGGQIVEQAIHIYDLARHFLGEAQTVCGFVDNLAHRQHPDYLVDDVSAATVRFRSGALASLCAANCGDPWAGVVDFTVLCERVMVEFRTADDATFVYHEGKSHPELSKQGYIPREEIKSTRVNYDELSRNFTAGIRGTEELRSSIEDGVESLRLVLAVAKSAQLGGAPQLLG